VEVEALYGQPSISRTNGNVGSFENEFFKKGVSKYMM
jgi:hypothetical protein